MKIVTKIFLISSVITILISCDYGPKATLNNDFEPYPNNKPIDFKKLIGIYELDNITKRKYDIKVNEKLFIKINQDSSFSVNKHIDDETGKITNKNKKGYIYITLKIR